MTNEEKEYLGTTNDILINYDNCNTVDSLKELIDEVFERNDNLLKNRIKQEQSNYQKPYHVIQICNYIMDYCKLKNYDMIPFKFNSVLFFCQSYFLQFNNSFLFNEKIRKARYGATIQEVTDYFHLYPITSNAHRFNDKYIISTKEKIVIKIYSEDDISSEDKKSINIIVDELNSNNPIESMNMIRNLSCWNKFQKDICDYKNKELFFTVKEMKSIF